MLIGLISDTHGLLRPEALAALAGSQLILHAGDVGKPDVLEELKHIAPVRAVRGNVDTDPWTDRLRFKETLEIDGLTICVIHNLNHLTHPDQYQVVIHGHTHQPYVKERDGVLYCNPGSAGPRRFRLPVTAGRLRIENGTASAELIPLEPGES